MQNSLSIFVFGANGGCGSQIVQQALDAGHQVKALVRNPEKLTLSNPKLKVIKGDVLIPETFDTELEGIDVVITALGASNKAPTVVLSVGVKNVLNAMEAYGVKRFLCISAQAIVISPMYPLWQKLFVKYILQPLLKNVYDDALRMEAALHEKRNLNWTIVRPPRLLNKPAKGKYRIAVNGYLKTPLSIARADVAHYMIHHLKDESTYRAVVEIAY